MENNDLDTTVVETPDPKSQPIAYAENLRSERLKKNSIQPDFNVPNAKSTDMVFKESVMRLTPVEIDDIMRNSGFRESAWKQTGVAIENALIGMNQMSEEMALAVGNLENYLTGGQIGEELQNIAYEALDDRMSQMALNEESVGGIRDFWAQVAGGAVSFTQLALEGVATAGILPLAQIGIQAFGEGTYNDMKKYADEHDGSLKGYRPKGTDVAINTANTIFQVASEAWLGVGSPRFMRGWSRGFAKEAGSGFVQESLQDVVQDFAEIAKGNKGFEDMLNNADQYLIDGVIGAMLQGPLGAVTYSQARRRSDMIIARAHAIAKGRKTPVKEDFDVAKKLNDAKERNYASVLNKEFKAAFDASTGEGQLQQNIASALNKAAESKELDLGVDNETDRAQKIEQIATQETLNAMEMAQEQGKAISEMELNNIVYRDGSIYLEGYEPEIGERAVDRARVIAERQSGLADVQMKLDNLSQEVQQTKKEIAEAKVANQQALVDRLQARLDKQNALLEKRRIQTEKLIEQTEKIQKQIEQGLSKKEKTTPKAIKPVEPAAPKTVEPLAKVGEKIAKKKGEKKSLKAERAVQKQAKAKKPTTPAVEDAELLHQGEEMQTPNVAPQIKEQFDLADENARLDDIYPAYDGETIEVDGKERTVYNSNGERIAKSEQALRNFYKWFGDSKVVDEQGRPLVVYHGTDAEFDTFDISMVGKTDYGYYGRGLYFARDIGMASAYGKNIMNVYLKINNPLNLNEIIGNKLGIRLNDSAFETGAFLLKKLGVLYPYEEARVAEYEKVKKHFVENVKSYNDGYFYAEYTSPDGDYYKSRASFYDNTEENAKNTLFKRYLSNIEIDGMPADKVLLKFSIADYMRGNVINTARFTDMLIKNGFDGVFAGDEIVVFEPNQIKSVDNRGTFSSDTGNILKQSKVEGTGSDKYRGGYDERLKRIILGEKSDLTTIQHEFAHYWMQNNFKWARSGLASAEWLSRWRNVEEALGIEPRDRYLSRQASEKFARAYEQYILQDKIDPDLQWAFDGFQKFYAETYEDLENEYFDLSEELDPAIVDWFNRQRPVTEQALKDQQYKKVADVAMAQGVSVITPVSDGNYVVSSMNENGEVQSDVVVTDEQAQGSKLAQYRDKKGKSGVVEGLREATGQDLPASEYNVLNRAETVEQAREWIANDRQGAWDAMTSDKTNIIDRTALFQAFKEEAENGDYELGAELANTKFPSAMTEVGQALSVLGERSEYDPLTILEMQQKALGEPTVEELGQQIQEMNLDAELDADQVKDLEETTECVL